MSRGLNKVMLIGNLGRDPEMRYTPNGRPVTAFSLAVSRAWLTGEGERREETEWFNVVAWGELAERRGERAPRGRRGRALAGRRRDERRAGGHGERDAAQNPPGCIPRRRAGVCRVVEADVPELDRPAALRGQPGADTGLPRRNVGQQERLGMPGTQVPLAYRQDGQGRDAIALEAEGRPRLRQFRGDQLLAAQPGP